METLHALIDRLASWKVNQIQLYSEHTFAYRDHEDGVARREPDDRRGDPRARRVLPRRATSSWCRTRTASATWVAGCAHDALPAPRAWRPTPDQPDRGPTHDRADQPGGPRARARACSASCSPTSRTTATCNVGLDEPWELPPERIDDYLEWVRALRALPELDGREMLVWGDILAGEPDRIAALPDGVTVCEWGYDAGYPFDARAAILRGRGPAVLGRARGRRAGSPSSAGSTNMRGTIARGRRRRRSRTAATACSTPTGATTATSSTCRSATRASRTARPCRGALATNRDLDLGAALSAHCYDDPTGELGETLVALGDTYLGITPQMGNVSALVLPLYWPQLIAGRWPLKGANADEYEAVAVELGLCRDAAGPGPTRPRRR